MKKLFQAIRKNDIDAVKQLIQKKPELVACTAKQPPKKDDGQSPLQVALKIGNLEIASFLLDAGADVNFIESETCCNQWRTPAIHDAINAAVMCSRWNVNSESDGLEVFSTKERADLAFEILKRMIAQRADVNAVDSYGNSCLWRLCLQARQILPSYNHAEGRVETDRMVTPELKADLLRIFALLHEKGADFNYATPNTTETPMDLFQDEPVGEFLRGPFA